MASGKDKHLDLSSFVIMKDKKKAGVNLTDASDCDNATKKIIRHIFGGQEEKVLDLNNLSEHIQDVLNITVETQVKDSKYNTNMGLIGPDVVAFDINSNVGTLFIETDKLGVTSHSNFSTIRANTCVFKGKWIYEVMLGSKGVMQLGWSTINCKFSQDEGVGDTPDSYAYDGNRLRKWNVKTQKYGEAWLTGDVISCAIDCDKGTITFYRNGRCLGKAFTTLRSGSGLAYFPAVSLSIGENLRVNFGATPLRYPIEGYRPLQQPPTADLVKAQVLFGFLESLLPSLVEFPKEYPQTAAATVPKTSENKSSKRCTYMVIAAHIFERLSPLLSKAYVVEACLLKFMLKFCDARAHLKDQPYMEEMLDLMGGMMQDYELRACLEHLVVTLLAAYRFSPVLPDFRFQQMYLILTLAVLRHNRTRRYLLKSVLFDKIKFPIFLHVKPPDDAGLIDIIPSVWWGFPKKEDDEDVIPDREDDRNSREAYLKACKELRLKVNVLEEIQVEILRVLLQMNDCEQGASSRVIFLEKLRDYLKENFDSGRGSLGYNQAPLPVTLCFFHRLIQAVRHYWDEYHTAHPADLTKSSEAVVPCHRFFDKSIKYFEIQRLGGLMSHLQKTYKDEIQKVLDEVGVSKSKCVYDKLTGLRSLLMSRKKSVDKEKEKQEELERQQLTTERASLEEILDGIIMMYHIAVHKQLSKMCTLREAVDEYVSALSDTEDKLKRCNEELPEVKTELERAREVFIDKLSELSRHMSWVIAIIYSREKQEDVFWLFQVVLRSIEQADVQGSLIAFVPDFYIDVCINTASALNNFFAPTIPLNALRGFNSVLRRYALFLSKYFADTRIVNSDSKDTLVQALAAFVCYAKSLRALESLPADKCIKLIENLLAPYENRSWGQTNWILVRFWKGCGFAYRYTQLPHQQGKTNSQPDILQRVCPSRFYQNMIREYLLADWERSVKFLDSLLNQLNWSFSEFIGMLQELQQYASRPERLMVDNRQLKICAICFDITVRLLRVLEMVIHLVPQFFTDWTQPSSESLIARLFQCICQVMNRIVTRTGVFETVIQSELPGLESVDHFPILASVAGILVQLIVKGSPKSQECATAAIIAEPSFQLSSLDYLLDNSHHDETATDKKRFSFRKYPKEVNAEEIQSVIDLISHLKCQQQLSREQLQSPDEDELCTICYASRLSVTFKPCGHQSCKKCISQHLLNKKECFFCKTVVERLEEFNGKQIKI
ncbi:E3 ubiquitin-protein ligase RNF123-like isoform X2 [Tubulanus polymorphus]|uniref:E3 ubiquitin-protein ligase RNF123-like isoform X2 n=1 Tax=Tubulanus polymorphus TaxID=672921 RepID=UPI003DA44556